MAAGEFLRQAPSSRQKASGASPQAACELIAALATLLSDLPPLFRAAGKQEGPSALRKGAALENRAAKGPETGGKKNIFYIFFYIYIKNIYFIYIFFFP